MALTFDESGLPRCCGVGLVPGEPYTACQVCAGRFDTQMLVGEIMKIRSAARDRSDRDARAAA
ncbi:MAG TPA: hypothetical protein VIM12_13890 [Noviherbaspirillum sp.]|jgi:hypothetical protein|uniref:hypothetical protein n=1 Tax=Noviherbaspirillum sp. TaxID=1926288 RepID=UPI002F958FB9